LRRGCDQCDVGERGVVPADRRMQYMIDLHRSKVEAAMERNKCVIE
jgi:hypothetical protein